MAWVVVPLFSMGCLFIAQEYIAKHYPQFGIPLSITLVVLMFVYNLVFTLWPAFVQQLPRTAAALVRLKSSGDFRTAMDLDVGPLKAQEILTKYREQTLDAEADSIGRGLQRLIEKRRAGDLGPDGVREEAELLARYRRLVQQSADLKRIITESAGNQATAYPPAPPQSQPNTRLSPASPPVSSPGGPSGRPMPSHREQAIVTPAPGTSSERSAISRARELDSLLNSFPPSNHRRVAVVFKSEDREHASVERMLYGSLKGQDQRIVTDLFQMPAFEAKGFFDEIDAGNTSVLVQTRAFSMIGYLLIGRVSDQCKKSSTIDPNLVTCTMIVVAKLFDHEGRLIDSNRVAAIAPGFSVGAALKDASQRAALALSKEFLKSVP